MSIADLRKDYKLATLAEADVDADPVKQFEKWLGEACAADLPEPTAMSLSTVSIKARESNELPRPSSRIVLLKEFDARGFVFFTNYESRKGFELAANPFAALLFHWVELERQVRVEGRIERISAGDSDAYFHSRPIASRLGALASPQSKVIPNREWLEEQMRVVTDRYREAPPRPQSWGGYRVVPDRFEFWQGRRDRLHDRIVYAQDGGRWRTQRLAP